MSKEERKRSWFSSVLASAVIAILAGAFAVTMVHNFVNQKLSLLGEEVEVIVAAEDLPPGTVIRRDHLVTRTFSDKSLHPQDVRAAHVQQMIGRRTTTEVAAFERLRFNQLDRPTISGGLPVTLDEGQRAMTIPVDRIAGVGGYIRPGDHIDILGTFVVPAEYELRENRMVRGEVVSSADKPFIAPWKITKVLMQDVTVLAVGSMPVDAALGAQNALYQSDYGDVTLQVSLTEAQILMFAMEQGSLSALLRNKDIDREIVDKTPAIALDNILEIEELQTSQSVGGLRFKAIKDWQ